MKGHEHVDKRVLASSPPVQEGVVAATREWMRRNMADGVPALRLETLRQGLLSFQLVGLNVVAKLVDDVTLPHLLPLDDVIKALQRRAKVLPSVEIAEECELSLSLAYNHKSRLERSKKCKFDASRHSFFLSGEQGKSPLQLYCYSKNGGEALKYSDKLLEMPEHTRTVQYFGIEGEEERNDFCFRCCDAKRFGAAQLLDGKGQWEEYYNASVRCSKREIEPLVDARGRRQFWPRVVALHNSLMQRICFNTSS
jgi:hypothetical protein